MKTISLVCTEHQERGLANATELRAILDRIQPEVIFLELPPDALEHFFSDGTKSNLESTAVSLYRENKNVILVPVDLPKPGDQFFIDYESLQIRIDNASVDSRRLRSWHRNYVRDYGFSYLNSDHCSNSWSEIYADENATIQKLGEKNLKRISDQWKKTIDLREEEMIKNILLSCRTLFFERAAFLIGAAHRQAIIEKSRQYSDCSKEILLWDYSCGANQKYSVRI